MSLAVGIVLAFTAAFAWGSSQVLFKVGVKRTDPLTATYVKGLIAIPLLFILAVAVNGISSIAVAFVYPNYIWLILAVITIILGDFLSLFSLKKINVSISQPVTAIYPLITTLILLTFSIEPIDWQIIVGTLVIISGVVVVSIFSQRNHWKNINLEETSEQDQETSIDSKKNMTQGIILAILAAIFWGSTIVFARQLIEETPEMEILPMMAIRNGLMVIVAAIMVFSRTLLNREKHGNDFFPPKKEALFLSVGGATAWCIGGVSFFNAVERIGAGLSTPLSSISPFIVILFGVVFLKEKISWPQILGAILIVIGSIILSIQI
ncbi:MAG: EamA family transporter [Candidatus Heimdallarchaeaceae archaeon]|jgi:drug/metabolite transporter (DMT)-like permease